MTPITIALGIPHAKQRPERVETLARLLERLSIDATEETVPGWGPVGDGMSASEEAKRDGLEFARVFDRPCPYWEWSSEMWHWQRGTRASHALVLQDDVIPMKGFWPVLRAMIEAVPDEILALETVHPSAKHFARERIGRWLRTSDGLIGVQYVLPRPILEEFLRWRGGNLEVDAETVITEDSLINCFALDTGRDIWHPVPTIAEHDTAIRSTNKGNDFHPFRNVSVRESDGDVCGWNVAELASPDFWRVEEPPAHLGLFYRGTVSLALQWVKSFDEAKYHRASAHVPPERVRKWMVGV